MRYSMIAILGLVLLGAGCGSVTGSETAGDAGSEQGKDVTLVDGGEKDTGGTATDAGQPEGGVDAGEPDRRDGGNVCDWPPAPVGSGASCYTVRRCTGAQGCAICCVTIVANGQCTVTAPAGCAAAAGVTCVGDCAECGGQNPGGPQNFPLPVDAGYCP